MTGLRRMAAELRGRVVEMSHTAQAAHLASSLSCADILAAAYGRVLRIDPARPQDPLRDRFILSKGHAAAALYAVLAMRGFFNPALLETYCQDGALLAEHPPANTLPGVEAATGSLGHGLPIGVGMALAKRITGQDGRIVVLIGDGEANEGTVWESALLAGHHALENLVCIVDHNHSTDRALMVDSLAAKFAAFGWNTVEIDGHDHPSILQALTLAPTGAPTVVIAETIKGRGIAQMENNPAWHHASPSAADLVEMFGDQS